ncbi:MAG: alpha/beta hydrolase [Verrucomicrobiota bacterium]
MRLPLFVVALLLAVSLRAQPASKALPPVPAGVTAHRDLAYVAVGHERQKLDLYLPAEGSGPFPVIVWIHGGAWFAGDRKNCPPLREGFVARGYAVASLGYRLSSHEIFPAQIEDCKAALRWLRAHAKEYRLDAAHIGVWGASAGGHLVSLLGTTDGVREFEVGAHLDQSSRVQAVVDYYGPTDFRQMDKHAPASARQKHDDPESPESRLIGSPIQDAGSAAPVRRANPITYLEKTDPPFLIVHGDADATVPHHQSVLLYEAAVAHKVAVHFITIRGGGHGTAFPYRELHPVVASFFAEQLKGEKPATPAPASRRSEMSATPMATKK